MSESNVKKNADRKRQRDEETLMCLKSIADSLYYLSIPVREQIAAAMQKKEASEDESKSSV